MQGNALIWAKKEALVQSLKEEYKTTVINPRRSLQRTERLFALIGYPQIMTTIDQQRFIPLEDLFSQMYKFVKEDDLSYMNGCLVVVLKLLKTPFYSQSSMAQMARLNLDTLIIHKFIHSELPDYFIPFAQLFSLLIKDPAMCSRYTNYRYHLFLFMSNLLTPTHKKDRALIYAAISCLATLSLIYQLDSQTIFSLLEIIDDAEEELVEMGLLLLLRYYEKLEDEEELSCTVKESFRVCLKQLSKVSSKIATRENAIKVMVDLVSKGMGEGLEGCHIDLGLVWGVISKISPEISNKFNHFIVKPLSKQYNTGSQKST